MDFANAVREISEKRSARIIDLSIKIIGFLVAIMAVGSWLVNIGLGLFFTFFGSIMILSILSNDDTDLVSTSVKFENSEWAKIWADFFNSLIKVNQLMNLKKI